MSASNSQFRKLARERSKSVNGARRALSTTARQSQHTLAAYRDLYWVYPTFRTPDKRRDRPFGARPPGDCFFPYYQLGHSTDLPSEDRDWDENIPDPFEDLEKELGTRYPSQPVPKTWLITPIERLRAKLKQGSAENADNSAKSTASASDGDAGFEVGNGDVGAAHSSKGNRSSSEPPPGKGQGEASTALDDAEEPRSTRVEQEPVGADSDGVLPKGESVDQEENEDDDDDDEEDDEERGAPPAVRHYLNQPESLTLRDVLRQRQKAMMEVVVREVPPDNLLAHLKMRGFFDYFYSLHARRSRSKSKAPTDARIKVVDKLLQQISL